MFFDNGLAVPKSKVKFKIEESLIYRRLSLISLNNFEWINLPEMVKPRYIERALFYYGSAAFAYNDEYGYIVLPTAITGDLDLYYEPVKWNVIGRNLVHMYDKENSVLMRNNQFCTPSEIDTRMYAEKIALVEQTIASNLRAHKVPWLFHGTSKQVLTMKTVFDKIDSGEPAIYLDPDIASNSFDVISANTPYIIDQLYDYKRQVWNEYLELYGYPTTQTEKNERLTMTESEVKVEFSDSGYVGAMYEYRKQACEEINKMFGLNIDVKINRYRQKSEEYYELENMKLSQGGFNVERKVEGNEEIS